MPPDGLSLIIPILDEHQAASRLGDRLKSIAEQADFPLEILLVNDGSRDATPAHLAALDMPGLTVLHHRETKGYGAALAYGIAKATHAWIAITDADETYPDHRIPELFAEARRRESDMLVGARTGTRVQDPMPRIPPKWAIRKLASFLCGSPIPDLNSGLRIMRRDMVQRYLHLMPTGMSFTSTIPLAAIAGGWQLDFVSIDYRYRTGRSKFRPLRDTANSLLLVTRAALWFPPLRGRGLPGQGDGTPHPDDATDPV